MTRRTKIWLSAGVGLLLWITLSWRFGAMLGLEGSDLWILRIGLSLLGAIAAGVLVWYFLRELRDKEGPPPPGQAPPPATTRSSAPTGTTRQPGW